MNTFIISDPFHSRRSWVPRSPAVTSTASPKTAYPKLLSWSIALKPLIPNWMWNRRWNRYTIHGKLPWVNWELWI